MAIRKTLTPYKFKRIAAESLRNSLRLHGDAMLLYLHQSYPSAFQLAVIALEELAKAKSVAHYYYSSITNNGPPEAEFEQEWLFLLYSHVWKQHAFVARDAFDYSPNLVRFIKSKELELKKQRATYVGLDRRGKKVDVTSRISIPERVKEADAKQLISLMNNEYVQILQVIQSHGEYFCIPEVDIVIDPNVHSFLFTWPHKTGLKARKFLKQHITKDSNAG